MLPNNNTTGSLPEFAILVAMTTDRLIGADNALPWNLPEDRHLFKELTFGNTVIMGRKTFEAIGGPLPGRNNIVISRTAKDLAGVTLCDSFQQALATGIRLGRPIFIIGGTSVYRDALEVADWLLVSWVKKVCRGDTYFPTLDLEDWQESERRAYPGFDFVRYRRINPAHKKKAPELSGA